MKIAVVGSGISGLTAAHILSREHEVILYESKSRLGGHTATIEVDIDEVVCPIDTGFIVYNDWTYPNFNRLLSELNVPGQKTEMGFSVTTSDNTVEYCGSSLNTLFSQRRNLINPGFYRLLGDISRFNRQAKSDFAKGKINPDLKLSDYLGQYNFGTLFISHYITPMASAIWSCSGSEIHDFQALFFIRFFHNHGLLNINNRPQWYVVQGGSKNYIPPLIKRFKDNIRLDSKVTLVKRNLNNVQVETQHGQDIFDYVVIATHSDQALRILESPTDEEQSVLGEISYRANSVIMHTDTSVMPSHRRAWTSWNYLIDGTEYSRPLLSYHMNTLQGLNIKKDIFVTVNGDQHIEEKNILHRFSYAHPQLTHKSIAAQSRWHEINNQSQTLYCGAYWTNGFHEDGVVSAIRAAQSIGVKWR